MLLIVILLANATTISIVKSENRNIKVRIYNNGKALGRRPFEMPALDLPLNLYPHPHLLSRALGSGCSSLKEAEEFSHMFLKKWKTLLLIAK